MNIGYKVIGKTEAAGTFNDIPYDNVVLHTMAESIDGKGYTVEQIKMKRKLYDAFPAQVGDVVLPIRNANGTLMQLISAQPWPEVKLK